MQILFCFITAFELKFKTWLCFEFGEVEIPVPHLVPVCNGFPKFFNRDLINLFGNNGCSLHNDNWIFLLRKAKDWACLLIHLQLCPYAFPPKLCYELIFCQIAGR